MHHWNPRYSARGPSCHAPLVPHYSNYRLPTTSQATNTFSFTHDSGYHASLGLINAYKRRYAATRVDTVGHAELRLRCKGRSQAANATAPFFHEYFFYLIPLGLLHRTGAGETCNAAANMLHSTHIPHQLSWPRYSRPGIASWLLARDLTSQPDQTFYGRRGPSRLDFFYGVFRVSHRG